MAIPSPQILAELREVAEMLQVINNMMLWRCNPDGTLDDTFGEGGVVIYGSAEGGRKNNAGNSIAIDSEGAILVAGYSMNASGVFEMALWRYRNDGTLDTTFGDVGIALLNRSAGEDVNDYGYSMAMDSDGRILVAGSNWNGSHNDTESWKYNYNMVLWRYNADGMPDGGFGNGGVIVAGGATGEKCDEEGYSVTTDLQGRILVTGRSRNASSNDEMVIWRYNPDGTPDSGFGSNGILVNGNAANGDGSVGKSITIDSQGRILVTGSSFNGSNSDMVLWRYNPDGTLDTTFGNGGMVVSDSTVWGNGYDYGNFITTDSQERILVTGWSRNASGNFDMVIWRFNADGTLDTSFGNGGMVVSGGAAGGSSGNYGSCIATDSQGRILVTGSIFNGFNGDMAVWRYNSAGTPDDTFNPAGSTPGMVVHNNAAAGISQDWGYSITTDSQGRILVTGWSLQTSNDNDMVIRRYAP